MTGTGRILAFTILSLFALGLSGGTAQAYDRWNNSGYTLDHNYYVNRSNDWIEANRNGHRLRQPAIDPSATDVSSTIADQKACKPVILYTDAGRIFQPADGCRR